jgi:hypothetical protein
MIEAKDLVTTGLVSVVVCFITNFVLDMIRRNKKDD